MENSLEIDFFDVDSGEKSGDAIAFRVGNFNDNASQKVVVIDGGTLETGRKLIEHIKSVYNTDYVDLVINTHPDGDHSSGLREIVKELNVGKLWMHRPWNHSQAIKDLFHDGRMTHSSLSQKMKDAYTFAHDLENIAIEKGVPIEEPFAGLTFGNIIQVLGPTKEYYQQLVPMFTKTPVAKVSTVLEKASSGVKGVIEWVKETMHIETLDEAGETSGENNSSVVLLLNIGGLKHLFTGDAGIPALKEVIAYSENIGIPLNDLTFMQVPHHGSRRNTSPSVLDKIMAKVAFVSASKDNPKHPSKKVLNAFYRRGANVFSTEGRDILHSSNALTRPGYVPINPHGFYDHVES